MNLPGKPSASRTLAVILIVFALIGTEFSYHFALESRFDAIEDKLQQNTLALQQFQSSLDSLSSSKSTTLAGLNQEVVALQSSFGPLGKETQEQSDALSQFHQQIASLQQAQDDELNAQKKLLGSVAQLERTREKIRNEPPETPLPPTAASASVTAAPPAMPPAVVAAPAAASSTSSAPVPAPSAAVQPQPAPAFTPNHSTAPVTPTLRPSVSQNQDSVDLRTDENDAPLPSPGMMAAHQVDPAESDTFHSVRALPVGASLSVEK